MTKPKPRKFDASAQRIFLKNYAENGSIAKSADVVGITSRTIRRHRESDPKFNAKAVHAKELFVGKLESIALAKASDRMIEMRLRKEEPAYNPTSTVISDAPIESKPPIGLDLLDAERRDKLAEVLKSLIAKQNAPRLVQDDDELTA